SAAGRGRASGARARGLGRVPRLTALRHPRGGSQREPDGAREVPGGAQQAKGGAGPGAGEVSGASAGRAQAQRPRGRRFGLLPPASRGLRNFGGAEGARTPDPKTASLVLSQLSYSPTVTDRVAWTAVFCNIGR